MLRRLALGAAAVAAAVCVLIPAAPAGAAANCLPDGNPLFIDYANPSVTFRDELFKRPGLVLTMEDVPTKKDGDPAAAFRAAGAATTFWDEHIEKIVGTPGSPANPGDIAPETAQLAPRRCRAPAARRRSSPSTSSFRRAVPRRPTSPATGPT